MKSAPNRDDISICTYLEVFAAIVKFWAEEVKLKKLLQCSSDGFYRVSCKADAIILLLMSHPNSKIRALCLQVLSDFYIMEKISLPESTAGKMSLSVILDSSEPIIVKQAIYGFLETGFRGVNLSSKIASSLTPLAFLDVANSSFTDLFRFYHGELVKRFSFYGRSKATRHLAKFLKAYAIPLIEQNYLTDSNDSKSLYSSYMCLLTAMSGISLKSEVSCSPGPKGINECGNLLFGSFQHLIPYFLTMDKPWETKALLNSFYFLHRDITQAFVSELMHW